MSLPTKSTPTGGRRAIDGGARPIALTPRIYALAPVFAVHLLAMEFVCARLERRIAELAGRTSGNSDIEVRGHLYHYHEHQR